MTNTYCYTFHVTFFFYYDNPPDIFPLRANARVWQYLAWQSENAVRELWYVVYTDALREMYAARELSAQGIEVFAPQYRTKKLLKPLFPRYIFARWDDPLIAQKVRRTRGVTRILSDADKPTPLWPGVVIALKAECDDQWVLLDAPTIISAHLKTDDYVKIIEGPWSSFCGRVRRTKDSAQRVTILLSVFGKEHELEFNADALMII